MKELDICTLSQKFDMGKEKNENFGQGWISLYRNIKNHWIFQNDKHFKWWVIMLFEVNHSENKIVRNYVVYNIQKGESCNCLRTWGNLFNTTPKTVSRFFDLLEKDKMISRSSLGKGKQALTLINISNYNDYQNKGKQGILQEVNKEETRSKQTLPTNNKGNNENKVFLNQKKENVYKSKKEFIDDWNEARKSILGVKDSFIKSLSINESANFNKISKIYTIMQIKDGMRGLLHQKNLFGAMSTRPEHLLRDGNLDKYIDAHLNKKQLYKDTKESQRY